VVLSLSFPALVLKVAQMQQLVIMLVVLGVTLLVALWVLWDRYEDVLTYLKEDGQLGRYQKWTQARKAKAAIDRGECPKHGTAGGHIRQGAKCRYCDYKRE
jgi:hypothetical protein